MPRTPSVLGLEPACCSPDRKRRCRVSVPSRFPHAVPCCKSRTRLKRNPSIRRLQRRWFSMKRTAGEAFHERFPVRRRQASGGSARSAPLAERLRPKTLDEILGQEHLLGPGKPLRTAIERDQVPSMILWGPPGVGKTTLAQVIARMTKSDFVPFSAVLSGIKEIKEVMASCGKRPSTRPPHDSVH